MTDLLQGDDEGGALAEPGRDATVEPRGRALLTDLVNELAVAPSGVSFIATCLDRTVEAWNLLEAWAVINDPVLGLQLFNAGRRPLELDEMPSTKLARGSGIHTEPTIVEEAADIDAIARLCEVALRLDRLHYESLHDPLTGLYNRRGFDDQLGAAISRSVRYGWSFGLVIIDLDGFKAINDRIGHQGGDAVLRQVGEQLRQGLRSGDVAARVGGDEFALMLHIEGPASLETILGRLHGTGGFGEAGDVEWTAGLAMCPDEAATVDDLYKVADQRLYEAKAAGAKQTTTEAR
jgi:diguanylate cyclase (GGDEF)-like protein